MEKERFDKRDSEKRDKRNDRRGGGRHHRRNEMDPQVKLELNAAMENIQTGLAPYEIKGLNAFQRKQVHRYFERLQEYGVKTYRIDDDAYVMKIFPVGALKRLAEQVAQEVLMQGDAGDLPPMGAYERYVIHDYLKDRAGIQTRSEGEGEDRHIRVMPIFGRSLKKSKRRLT